MHQYLHVFVVVVQRKNFTRAAEELHMTQPAVSQHIKALENIVGESLLDRNNKYVQVNRAGEVVYQHAKEILGIYNQMLSLIQDLSNEAQGKLSIGASYTYGEYILPRILAKLKAMYPHIEPSVTIGNTEKIANLVSSYRIDVGIVEGHFKNSNLIQKEIGEDELVIVSSFNHPIGHKSLISTTDLEKETWIIRESGSGTRESTDLMFQQFNVFPRKILVFSSTQSIKEGVSEGLGISFLSKSAINKDLKNNDLKIMKTEIPKFTRKFTVITKSPFETKVLKVFKELL